MAYLIESASSAYEKIAGSKRAMQRRWHCIMLIKLPVPAAGGRTTNRHAPQHTWPPACTTHATIVQHAEMRGHHATVGDLAQLAALPSAMRCTHAQSHTHCTQLHLQRAVSASYLNKNLAQLTSSIPKHHSTDVLPCPTSYLPPGLSQS